MIAKDRDLSGGGPARGDGTALAPEGLPDGTAVGTRLLACGESLSLLTVPSPDADGARSDAIAEIVRDWVDAEAARARSAALVVPLYGCLAAWAPGRAAAVGPADRIGQLEAALVEFAELEANLRGVERRTAALLEHAEADAGLGIDSFDLPDAPRLQIAERYREAVAAGRRLALLAPAIHAAPTHPPSLASQLGERLRERARFIERHGLAVDRAELVERVTEACGQRLLDVGIARRQTALEWAIVVLLVAQTMLVVVDLLATRAAP